MSESHVTWATSVPILCFRGLSVLGLGPMYATDRRQTNRRQTKASLNASALWERRHNNQRCIDDERQFETVIRYIKEVSI